MSQMLLSDRTLMTRAIAGALALVFVLGLTACNSQERVRMKRADAHLAQAEQLKARGLTDAALSQFGLALEENPKLVEAHMGMGEIYKDFGDYELASRAYERATDVDPTNFDAHYNLALMKQLMGQVQEAIRVYLTALTLDPRSFEANRDLASAYLQVGDTAVAVRYAERATQLNPDSQEAWTNLAAAYSLLGRYEEAVDAYRQAAEQGELSDQVLLGLADAHIRLGNYARAINVLDSLIRNNPSATAYERLGYAKFKLREFRQALKNFRMSIALDENDTAALNGVGVCLMTLYIQGGQENNLHRDQAIDAWRQSLQLRPDQPRIVDLLARYQRG